MYYYKYNNKLIPIYIQGVDTDAPYRNTHFKLVLKNNVHISENININNIISLENMYSKNKIDVLLPISKDDNLINGDLVLFIDNNAASKHNNTYGWCSEMSDSFNTIGVIVNKRNDDYVVLFNEETTWTILSSCLLKISKKIKIL